VTEERRSTVQLDRIEAKLDQVGDRVSHIDTTLARQATILEEHQRRSLANEATVEMVRQELDPLKRHVAAWAGAGKVLMVSGALAALATAVLKLSGF
jgi:hypothetical protein